MVAQGLPLGGLLQEQGRQFRELGSQASRRFRERHGGPTSSQCHRGTTSTALGISRIR